VESVTSNAIWRFYIGDDHRWRWQCLSASTALIAESATSYANYETCLKNARKEGYVFYPSPTASKQVHKNPKDRNYSARIPIKKQA